MSAFSIDVSASAVSLVAIPETSGSTSLTLAFPVAAFFVDCVEDYSALDDAPAVTSVSSIYRYLCEIKSKADGVTSQYVTTQDCFFIITWS